MPTFWSPPEALLHYFPSVWFSWLFKIHFLPAPKGAQVGVGYPDKQKHPNLHRESNSPDAEFMLELQPMQLSRDALTFKRDGPPLSPLWILHSQGYSKYLVFPPWCEQPFAASQDLSTRGYLSISDFSPLLQSGFSPSFPIQFLREIFYGWEAKRKKDTEDLGIKQAFVYNLLGNFLALKSWTNY